MLLSFLHFNIFFTTNQTYIMIFLIILKVKDNLVILFFIDLNIILIHHIQEITHKL